MNENSDILVEIKDKLDEIYDLLHDPDRGVFVRIHNVADDVKDLIAWRRRMERIAMAIGTPVIGLVVKAFWDVFTRR